MIDAFIDIQPTEGFVIGERLQM